MSTAKSPLRARQQQRVREDLVQATLGIIARSEVGAASVDQITAESGMSRATLYAHFPGGRDSLLRAAYEEVGRALLARASAAAETQSSWHERILAYARTMIEFSRDPFLGHFYNISGPHLMGFRAERGIGSQGYFEAIRTALAEAAAAGELDPAADLGALASLLAGSLRDAGIEVSREPERAEAYIDSVRRILTGLRAR